MSEKEIYFGPSRTGGITGEGVLNDYTVYEIQTDDKVLGGKYWLPTEPMYDEESNPVINEQAYELGVRDIFLDVKYQSITTNLQDQIDEINKRADVVDIVGTKQNLKDYDVTHLTDNDVIKVLQDESEDYRCVYYRFIEVDGFNIVAPYAEVFNTDQDMDPTGLSADDYVEVLADSTHLDPTTGDPMTTYYKYNGSTFEYAGCWEFIGYERETKTVTISGTETIIPSDETLYLLTIKAGEDTIATIDNSGAFPGCDITFIALTDSVVKYNPVESGGTTTYTETTLKTGQTLDLYYSGTAWMVRNSSSLDTYINLPYKTYKNPGTFCYFYDGTNIASTYDIPSDKGSLLVSWENANNARALFIDNNRIIKTRVLNSGTWGTWDEFVDLATAQTVTNKTVDAHDNVILCSPTEYSATNNPNTVSPSSEMNIVLSDANATVVIDQMPYHGYELPITCMASPGYVVYKNILGNWVCVALTAGQSITLHGSSTADDSYYLETGTTLTTNAATTVTNAPNNPTTSAQMLPNNYKDFLGAGTYSFLYDVSGFDQTYDLPAANCSVTAIYGSSQEATAYCVRLNDTANPDEGWIRNFVTATWGAWTNYVTTNGTQTLTNKTYALGSANASKAVVTDASGNITVSNIDASKIVSTDGVQTLTNKTISFDDNTLQNVASLNTTQTLTNKTYALGAGNADKALITDASGNIVPDANVSSTEVGYLDGVTSNIQTQLNAKEPTVVGAATSIVQNDLTASKVLVSDANGKVAVGAIDSDKVVGTDSVQTLSNKTIAMGSANGNKVVTTDVGGNIIVDPNIDTTELGYLNGVTSNIQTQLNSKQGNLTAGLGINISAQNEITTDNLRIFEYGDTNYSRISGQILSNTTYPDNKLAFIIVDNTLASTIDGIAVAPSARRIPVIDILHSGNIYYAYGKYISNFDSTNAALNYSVTIDTTNQTVTWSRTAAIDAFSAGDGITITLDTTSTPQTKVIAADVSPTSTVELTNKTIDKSENTIIDNSIEVDANKTLTSAEYRREVKYYLTGNGITFTLPNFNDTDCELYAGSKKTIVSGEYDNYVTYSLEDGLTTKTDTIKAGEVATYVAVYDDTNSLIYWKRDLSDPDPIIVTQTGNTGVIGYENYNQIVTQPNVVLTLGDGDKQGREVSITFLENGTLIYEDQDGNPVTDTIDANTVQKFKWTGDGWILETQKIGSTMYQEIPLVPLLTSNSDKGFTLGSSSEYSTDFQAYNAFSDHPIIYNIGSTIMYDNSAFISNGDGENTYLTCVHPTIITQYKYLHVIDRGTGSTQDPSTVSVNGVTQYTISGTQDGGSTWETITTYSKDPSATDVIIQLNTNRAYNGFKIATTGVTGGIGSAENIGFRKVQMYIPSKAIIQETTESSNNVNAYAPLVPLMNSNSERGFVLSQSSTKSGYEAYHAFNQHTITYFIGANGMVNLESSATNGDGDQSWIACTHSDFGVNYGFIHLIDNGISGLDPEVVVDNGITEYTIYGLKNGSWELITTYIKSASLTDVKIPLNTTEEYYGFKVCASAVIGSTGDIGWRQIQMYVPNKQEIQYVSEVDPNPIIVSENMNTGLVTYYNCKFVTTVPGLTLTVSNADKIGREALIIPNEAVTLIYNNKLGVATTLSLAQHQKAKLTWNGTGYYCEYAIVFSGTDDNDNQFTYNFVTCV